jgi:pSer/pThr/pTyr-binding forkhead associated (FHA) protein
MPETKTSQFRQPPLNFPPMSKEPFDLLEPPEGHLLIVEDDKGRREIPLGGEVYSIGRAPDADIRLFSMFVSRRHATLVRRQHEDGSYYYRIIDGNLKGQFSANGLLINGRKLQAHDLENEDEVLFDPRVKAKYYRRRRGEKKSGPLDPFDITLINPGMVDEEE